MKIMRIKILLLNEKRVIEHLHDNMLIEFFLYWIFRFALNSIFNGHHTLDIKWESIENNMRNEMKSLFANRLIVLILFRYYRWI